MAGAMRRMGIYLGLVEEDDARGYGRYDARQGDYADRDYADREYADRDYADRDHAGREHAGREHAGRDYADRDHDRRYGRYAAVGDYPAGFEGDTYGADRYGADRYGDAADEEPAEELSAAREPEPLTARRAPARPLGLAPSPASAGAGSGASRVSSLGGSAGAAGLAVREQPAAPEPAPAPVLQPYRITTVTPRTDNEARLIGERYREGCPVIMNLTELDDADAKRLVDFAAGLIFGLRGSIERVTAKVFLLSPQNVDVTAEDKARIREGGFFNQS